MTKPTNAVRQRNRTTMAILARAKICVALCISLFSAFAFGAATDPFAEQVKEADAHIRFKKYDKALPLLLPIMERQPDHARALHLIGVILLEKGDSVRGMKAITAAWKIQGSKPIWSPEDKDIFREINKSLLKYDIKFRDARKADDKFIGKCADLMKKYNEEETRDIFNDILFICMQIDPGNDKVRPFFQKEYRGDEMFANRFKDEGTELFDPENARDEDRAFMLDFGNQANFRRLTNIFKLHEKSNPVAAPSAENGYHFFDIEYGDPYAYMVHRRAPFLAGRQFKIEFTASGDGRIFLGSPVRGIGLVVDVGAKKAFPVELTEKAVSFKLGSDGYGEAIIQHESNGTLSAFVNGTQIFSITLDPGQTADMARTNLFYGLECKPRDIRIFRMILGPVTTIQTVESDETGETDALSNDAPPKILDADRIKADTIYDEAQVKIKTNNWNAVIEMMSDVVGYNPLRWDAYRHLGDAQEKRLRRRAAVATWQTAVYHAAKWGNSDVKAQELITYAEKRLDEIDTEGKRWRTTTKEYVDELLGLRDKLKTDQSMVRRIEARIKLVRPDLAVDPLQFAEPETKKAVIEGLPKIPGLDDDEPLKLN